MNELKIDFHDMFEIKYLDDGDVEKIKYFNFLDSAKDFVKNSVEKKYKILIIHYYVYIWISESNTSAKEPNKKFAEHIFTTKEFLSTSFQWVEEARNSATAEIENYIKENLV